MRVLVQLVVLLLLFIGCCYSQAPSFISRSKEVSSYLYFPYESCRIDVEFKFTNFSFLNITSPGPISSESVYYIGDYIILTNQFILNESKSLTFDLYDTSKTKYSFSFLEIFCTINRNPSIIDMTYNHLYFYTKRSYSFEIYQL